MNAKAACRIVILHFLLLAFVSSGPIGAAETRPLLLDRDAEAVASDLNILIPQLMEKGHVPGLQIALIRDGSIVWSGAFGVANAASRTPVTSETIFEAASVREILLEHPPEMPLVENDRMVETFPPDRPDQSFNVWILPRRSS